MKVYISADGEGITGVVTPREMYPGKPGYEFARRMMVLDVNAAIRGAFDAGAIEVIVNDAHWNQDNMDIELLDPRADLIRGGGKHLSMLEGVQGCDAAVFIGYHARAGASDGVGNESIFGREVIELRMNGKPVGEGELNAYIAGAFNVLVVAVSGDDIFIDEIKRTLPKVSAAVVKFGIGRFSARCIPPARSHEIIRQAVFEGVTNYKKIRPLTTKGKIELETEFMSTAEAKAASLVPGSVRKSPRVVAVYGQNMAELWKAFKATHICGADSSDEIYG